MDERFPVTWAEPSGAVLSGQLRVGDQALELEREQEPYRELLYSEIARARLFPVLGRDDVVLEARDGPWQFMTEQPAALLLELESHLRRAPRRLAVALRLKPGMRERARRLLAQGPPFDPFRYKLERHQALLFDDCVVFEFEAPSPLALEALARDESLLSSAEEWRPLLDGAPQLAEGVYSFEGPVFEGALGLGM